MKRRVKELDVLAVIEKSGHYFLAGPIGRGYDAARGLPSMAREGFIEYSEPGGSLRESRKRSRSPLHLRGY